MQFNHIVCGGTFDHLHKGHRKLLEACLKQGKKVSIGITSRAMTRHKLYNESIESYAIRSKNILQFITERKYDASLISLSDIFGSTLTDSTIDAIFVTQETFHGAEKINRERIKTGMKPLSIVTIPLAYGDDGGKISSERIRQGLIDREGMSYYKYLISRGILTMPELLKGALRKPLGRIISSLDVLSDMAMGGLKVGLQDHGYTKHISVGDVITYNLKKMGITPSISVIDGMTRRKALNKTFIDAILEKDCSIAPNKKGTIQVEAVTALYVLFTSGHNRAIKQLLIHGEEDLLTLVAILFSPLKSHVWYGQKDKGAVDVLVTENKKQTVYNLLKKFK
jgi:pantetheine-phosphate adenylyltransferase